jgi:methyltransferase (TIGR00027 family)
MSQSVGPIRNVSDTARWVAVYRARETERPDAVFHDPFAKRLAGARGEEIAASMAYFERDSWPFVTRTYLFDQFITEQLRQGVDMIVNLAAGLDARPYRMPLPSSLIWIEVDLPELLSYKEEILAAEKPACVLERIRLDLANTDARRDLFVQLGARARNAMIITEGLLTYLTADEVGSLANDLAVPGSFRRWVLDLASPGLLRMLQKKMGPQLAHGGATLNFGPEAGPAFFERHGWRASDVRSILKTAARLKRVPFWMRLIAMLPQSNGRQGSRPWSGVCLFERQ